MKSPTNPDREGALGGSSTSANESVFTVKEAAEKLKISTKLVYALCAKGKIIHERYGVGRGTIRITKQALKKYRREARVKHGTSTPVVLKHIKIPDDVSPS